MEYKNPQPPEGINVSRTHPLKEMALLAGGAILIIVILAFVLGHTMGYLARFVPFEKEVELTQGLELPTDAGPELQRYLDRLTGRISRAMNLPPEMRVRVHYSRDGTVNAFATLGGHLMLFRGLLEKMPSENTLTMLIAHEVAHIKHRDPVSALGTGAVLQLMLTLTVGYGGADILGEAGLLTMLHFTRNMEGSADSEALETVDALYGHVNGAAQLFEIIQAERAARHSIEPPAFFRTHPLDTRRIQAIRATAAANGWPLQGEITPLPDAFKQWLSGTKR